MNKNSSHSISNQWSNRNKISLISDTADDDSCESKVCTNIGYSVLFFVLFLHLLQPYLLKVIRVLEKKWKHLMDINVFSPFKKTCKKLAAIVLANKFYEGETVN